MQTPPPNSRLTLRRWSPIVPGLLAILWLASSGVPSVHADRATIDPTKTQIALPLSTPPTIDGTIAIDEWNRAGGAANNFWRVGVDPALSDGVLGGVIGDEPLVPDDADDLSFNIYAGYDSNYLYIAVRVRDSVISTDTAEAGSTDQRTWDDDSVEVFVDGYNANAATWSGATGADKVGGQYVITANNAYQESGAGHPGYGPNAAWYAKTALTATGYEAEFRIALTNLGNPKPGDIIGFSVAVNDDDAGGPRESQILWVGATHKPVTYGNLLLGSRSYTAPKTAAPVIDGKINASEYAGATEIKVDRFNGIYDITSGDDTWEATDHAYSAWVVHDADAIYVAFNVNDDQIVNDNANAQPGMEDGNTWEDDSVEIFFDSDSDKNLGANTIPFEGQYVFSANGARRDNEAGNPPNFGLPGGWFAAATRTAKNYQVEFKIPKANLQNPVDRTSMGFHLALNDDDGSGRKAQLGWTGYAHQEFTYGKLTLGGASTPTAPRPTISVNFQGRILPGAIPTVPLAPTDVAGVVAVGNWNNVADSTPATAKYDGSPTGALVDSTGAATTVTLIFDANGGWNNETPANQATTGDAKMMRGIVKQSLGDPEGSRSSGNFTFRNVPEGQYDVYVYTGTDSDVVEFNLSDNHNSTTYYVREVHQFPDGTAFVQAKNTNPAGPRDRGSYVKFSNLGTLGTGAIGFTATPVLPLTGFGGLGIAGIQLVPLAALSLRIVEAKPDLATGDLVLRWEGGVGPQFQVEKAATVTGPFQPLSLPQSQRAYTDKGALKTGAQSFYRIKVMP